MSGGFVKIYSSILRSSVWQQPLATKVVWITLLALADADGVVESSIPGLAAQAGTTIEDCEAALACFLAPDKYSGSKVDEGRRIRPCRGGWLIVNHGYYREFRTEKQLRDAARIASKRAQSKTRDLSPSAATSTTCRDVAPEAEAKAEILHSSDSPPATRDTGAAPSGLKPRAAAEAESAPDVRTVFECWQTEHGKQRSKLDAKRSARIKARLREGFTVEQLCQAIRGAKKDEFLMGQHPRASRAFDGIEIILRDLAQVERLIELEEGATGRAASATNEENWL